MIKQMMAGRIDGGEAQKSETSNADMNGRNAGGHAVDDGWSMVVATQSMAVQPITSQHLGGSKRVKSHERFLYGVGNEKRRERGQWKDGLGWSYSGEITDE